MKLMAFAAPGLLLAYGILRWIDGLDGHRKGGPAWTLGHLAFFASTALFAVLAVLLYRRATVARRVALVALASSVSGAGLMLWVITGDLSGSFRDRWPLPDPLQIAGPALFCLGLITLLSVQVAADRLPVWSPILFFLGYTAISINLDLLPLAGVLILGAAVPLAPALAPPPPIRAAEPSPRG